MAFSADFGEDDDVYIDEMSDVSGFEDAHTRQFPRGQRVWRRQHRQLATSDSNAPRRSTAAQLVRNESSPGGHTRPAGKPSRCCPNYTAAPSKISEKLPHYFDAVLAEVGKHGRGRGRGNLTSVGRGMHTTSQACSARTSWYPGQGSGTYQHSHAPHLSGIASRSSPGHLVQVGDKHVSETTLTDRQRLQRRDRIAPESGYRTQEVSAMSQSHQVPDRGRTVQDLTRQSPGFLYNEGATNVPYRLPAQLTIKQTTQQIESGMACMTLSEPCPPPVQSVLSSQMGRIDFGVTGTPSPRCQAAGLNHLRTRRGDSSVATAPSTTGLSARNNTCSFMQQNSLTLQNSGAHSVFGTADNTNKNTASSNLNTATGLPAFPLPPHAGNNAGCALNINEEWPDLAEPLSSLDANDQGLSEGHENTNVWPLVDIGPPCLDSAEFWGEIEKFCANDGPLSFGKDNTDLQNNLATSSTKSNPALSHGKVIPPVGKLVDCEEFKSASSSLQAASPLSTIMKRQRSGGPQAATSETEEVTKGRPVTHDIMEADGKVGNDLYTRRCAGRNVSSVRGMATEDRCVGARYATSGNVANDLAAVNTSTSSNFTLISDISAIDRLEGIEGITAIPDARCTARYSHDSTSSFHDTHTRKSVASSTPVMTSSVSDTPEYGGSLSDAHCAGDMLDDTSSVSDTSDSVSGLSDTPGLTAYTCDPQIIESSVRNMDQRPSSVSDTSDSRSSASDTPVSDSSTTQSSPTPDGHSGTSVHSSTPNTDVEDNILGESSCTPDIHSADSHRPQTNNMAEYGTVQTQGNTKCRPGGGARPKLSTHRTVSTVSSGSGSTMDSPSSSSLMTPTTPASDLLESVMGNNYTVTIPPAQDQTWSEMDVEKTVFVETSNWDDALDLLETTSPTRIILSGPPGSGKRTIGRALLRRYESKGFACLMIKTAAEWRERVGGGQETHQRQIVMIEHMFGKFQFEQGKFDAWEPLFQIMLQYCKQEKVLLVLTMYTHILQLLQETYPDRELFDSECRLTMRELDEREKKEMVQCHLRGIGRNASVYNQVISHLSKDRSGCLFPECCRRWIAAIQKTEDPSLDIVDENSAPSLDSKDMVEIFFQPVSIYRDFFLQILRQNESDKEVLMAAFTFLLTLTGPQVKLDAEDIQNHCQQLGFSSFSPFQLASKLKTFRPIFVDGDHYQFVNRFVYEGVALALGKHYPDFVVKAADWRFVINNCAMLTQEEKELRDIRFDHRLDIHRVSSKKTRRSEYFALVNRLVAGLQDPECLVIACQHPNLLARQLFEDIMKTFNTNDEKLAFLTGIKDRYGTGFFYWSVWCRSCSLTEWIFKTVFKLGGKFEHQDLELAVCACCMLGNKEKTLALLLRYWEKCTGGPPTAPLLGSYSKQPLTLPLPDEEVCYSIHWKAQLQRIKENFLCSHREVFQQELSDEQRSLRSRQIGQGHRRQTVSVINIVRPPLHLALLSGNKEQVFLLMNESPDSLNIEDHAGRTVVHLAAVAGDVDVMDALLERDLPCLLSHSDEVPLHESCRRGYLKVSELLLRKWPNHISDVNSEGQGPVFLAVASGNLELVELLILHGAVMEEGDDRGDTLLHVACRRPGNQRMVQRLADFVDVDARNKHLDSPLHIACGCGDSGMVQALVNADADVDARNISESTPLHCAAESGLADVVRVLLKAGADKLIPDNRDRFPHHYATCHEVAFELGARAREAT